jgi:hypothetical protein
MAAAATLRRLKCQTIIAGSRRATMYRRGFRAACAASAARRPLRCWSVPLSHSRPTTPRFLTQDQAASGFMFT